MNPVPRPMVMIAGAVLALAVLLGLYFGIKGSFDRPYIASEIATNSGLAASGTPLEAQALAPPKEEEQAPPESEAPPESAAPAAEAPPPPPKVEPPPVIEPVMPEPPPAPAPPPPPPEPPPPEDPPF